MRWRQADSEERQLAWLWGAAALSAVVFRPLWLAAAPLLPACPLHHLTGIPCPTCGSTRAGLALLNGDLLAALMTNPGATLAGMAFILGGALAPLWVRFGGKVPDLPSRWPRWARLAVLGLILANWAWLLATLPRAG